MVTALAGDCVGVVVVTGLLGGDDVVFVVVGVVLGVVEVVPAVGVPGGEGELLRSLRGDTGDRAAAARGLLAGLERGVPPAPSVGLASGLSGATGLRLRFILMVPPVCNRGGLAFTLSFSLPAHKT